MSGHAWSGELAAYKRHLAVGAEDRASDDLDVPGVGGRATPDVERGWGTGSHAGARAPVPAPLPRTPDKFHGGSYNGSLRCLARLRCRRSPSDQPAQAREGNMVGSRRPAREAEGSSELARGQGIAGGRHQRRARGATGRGAGIAPQSGRRSAPERYSMERPTRGRLGTPLGGRIPPLRGWKRAACASGTKRVATAWGCDGPLPLAAADSRSILSASPGIARNACRRRRAQTGSALARRSGIACGVHSRPRPVSCPGTSPAQGKT